jgi:hypothetical protein
MLVSLINKVFLEEHLPEVNTLLVPVAHKVSISMVMFLVK